MRSSIIRKLSFLALLFLLPVQLPQIAIYLAPLRGAAQALQTQPAQAEPPPRKTSPPFAGDPAVFEEKDRDRKLQIERVMDVLGIKQGATVADIGAGSGWFTVRAAKRVGRTGTVYAVEINPNFVRYLGQRAKAEGFGNIRTVLGKDDDPMLPPNSLDSVLLLKTYHEVAKPVPLLRNLREALKPGARVGIIDRNGKGDDHGIDRAVVIKEARLAGYELIEEHDFVKSDEGVDYFLVFRAVKPITAVGMREDWLIVEGERWWKQSPDARNPVACATCHHDPLPPRGWAASFPKVKPLPPPHTRVMTLLQANAEAVTRHYGLADPQRAATAITAYLTSAGANLPISPGVSFGQPIFEGRMRQLKQSVKRGEATFALRCHRCHVARVVAPATSQFPRLIGNEPVPLESFLESHQPDVPALTWDGQDMADLVAYLMSRLAGQPLIANSAARPIKEKP